ncbi:MAG TPA: C25 family cysteine peptidase [Candidatus Brocadiia bacterium]|nr:C25 family cysteine peptidase [Candidatus Brocadiia bacterium]
MASHRMKLTAALAIAVLFSASVALAAGADKKDQAKSLYLVIAPSQYGNLLKQLLETRERQGLATRLVTLEDVCKGVAWTPPTDEATKRKATYSGCNEPYATAVREYIKSVAAKEQLRYVLLVGAGKNDMEPSDIKDHFPAFYIPHYELRKVDKPGRPVCTDLPYSDTDGDGMPDLMLGRLPVYDEHGLRVLLWKMRQYESSPVFTPRRRRVFVLAGTTGFAPESEAFIVQAGYQLLGRLLTTPYSLKVIFASEASQFCYPFERTPEAFVEELAKGAAFSCYSGHGYTNGFYLLKLTDMVPSGDSICPKDGIASGRGEINRLLSAGDIGRGDAGVNMYSSEKYVRITSAHMDMLDWAPPSGPMFAYACWTGRYDDPAPAVAIRMLLQHGGPVACVAATHISDPYVNSLTAEAVLEAVKSPPRRLGALYLSTAVKGFKAHNALGWRIRSSDPSSPKGLSEEEMKKNHIAMYNLFGDPAMPLSMPSVVEVKVAGMAQEKDSGKSLKVEAKLPFETGKAWLFLEQTEVQAPDPASMEAFVPTETEWQKANNMILSWADMNVKSGRFEGLLPLPKGLKSGRYAVKIYATDYQSDAAGCATWKLAEQSAGAAQAAKAAK